MNDVLPAAARVKVGIEAAGHYHRPLLALSWPTGWELVELNPAHVTEQRRVQGRRRVKTDAREQEIGELTAVVDWASWTLLPGTDVGAA